MGMTYVQKLLARACGREMVATGEVLELPVSLAMSHEAIVVPKSSEWLSPALNVVPLQLFAYEVALLRGCDIDKPRNLAKSVTVE